MPKSLDIDTLTTYGFGRWSILADRCAEMRQQHDSTREPAEEMQRLREVASCAFEDVFEYSQVMMCGVDNHFRIAKVNHRWVETMGYHRDEVLGHQSICFLADESRLQAEEDALPLLWKAGAARSVGFQFVKKDGRPLDILLDANIAYTHAGSPFTLAAHRNRADTA